MGKTLEAMEEELKAIKEEKKLLSEAVNALNKKITKLDDEILAYKLILLTSNKNEALSGDEIMSKAILIIDMPSCCDECFALDDNGDYPFCLVTHEQRGYNFRTREQRMPKCPLRPAPEK